MPRDEQQRLRGREQGPQGDTGMAEAGGTAAGAAAGALAGSVVGPVGTVAGAVAGGALGNAATDTDTEGAENRNNRNPARRARHGE